MGALLLMVVLAPFLGAGRAVAAPVSQLTDPDWTPPRTVYIPETGHTIDGYFLDLWRESGGFYTFGNPITPEYTLDNGHVVQYYQYARFEYWPEGDADGNVIVLGNIGEELRPVTVRRWSTGGATAAKDSRATRGQPANAAAELIALTQA